MSSPVREIHAASVPDAEHFLEHVVGACEPVVIRDLVGGWPVVAAARKSPQALRNYLMRLDAGRTMEAFLGDPAISGKYYYADGLDGFNFERETMPFSGALDRMVASIDDPEAKTVYAGSLSLDDFLPGFSSDNPMPLLDPGIGGRIWLGHASNVSSHHDRVDNLACVVAGKRRFTLFSPELTGSLYVGPIDHTMAGQPVSLAASQPRDDALYPRFAEVRDQAMVAELEAGDALYLPKLWWHQVEATAPLNGLVNYWWDAFPQGPDAPYTALLLAMIAVSERPPRERQAWKAYFDHYVFRTDGHPLAHLPPERHGLLGPLRPHNYGRIRAHIMHLLRGG